MKSGLLDGDGFTCLMFTFEATLDHRQVEGMARVVEAAISTTEDLRLLLDLRATRTFDSGAFLSPKGLLASIRSIGPISRYAVVGAPSLAATAVAAFGTKFFRLKPARSRLRR
ncbi:MAG: hypothetical protein GW858_05440 [Sphingomonadales bacterium]|nr:hypothetical protein [Sphingomonadales bacterium]NCQ21337.1 hypothetical protein [Sphingomonadales bacterium]NCT03500.1 hypothetical protein [Sphingomonadales bacterium]